MDVYQGYDAALASLRSCSCKLLNYLVCFMSVACSRICVMLLACLLSFINCIIVIVLLLLFFYFFLNKPLNQDLLLLVRGSHCFIYLFILNVMQFFQLYN